LCWEAAGRLIILLFAAMLALLIPTGSDHDRTRLPLATVTLIAVNVLVDVVTNLLDHAAIAKQFGFVAANPQWYQWFTHLFLHAGMPANADAHWTEYLTVWLHITGNMLYLWFAGSDVEDVLGTGRFLALYFLSGFASAGLFLLTAMAGHFPNLDEPCVGASGAIAGLLGFYLVRFPRFKIRLWFAAVIPFPLVIRQGVTRISSLVFIGFWIGLQLVYGTMALKAGGAQVAYWGHIGGFLLGLTIALATRQWRWGGQEYWLKEADYRFYKQRWYPAMETYQRVAKCNPRCVAAVTQWALCWECLGMPARAEKVLLEAATRYRELGWDTEAEALDAELLSMARKSAMPATAPVATPFPNLMFRKQFKWKGKSS
jgi:membrane associated rhomboid family serine protease